MTKLRKELTKVAASVPTTIGGGGGGGHAGILIKKRKYVTVLEGEIKFTIPSHTRYYPSATSDYTKVRAKEYAQHSLLYEPELFKS